ncbi:hypothetical protein SDC9_193698 [bioreactor metagenome]|uniref:Uncharacterized protein n=1 Tax=bioreactor metagenome TaxID=1076179 RepID=A0A645I486_9ZZZZ
MQVHFAGKTESFVVAGGIKKQGAFPRKQAIIRIRPRAVLHDILGQLHRCDVKPAHSGAIGPSMKKLADRLTAGPQRIGDHAEAWHQRAARKPNNVYAHRFASGHTVKTCTKLRRLRIHKLDHVRLGDSGGQWNPILQVG